MAGLDANILLQAQGVQAPDIGKYAQTAISLANMSMQNQMQQFALAKQQQLAPAVQEMAQAPDPESYLPTIASKYPLAYPEILQQYKTAKLTEAQAAAETGKATQATAAAFKDAWAPVTNMAASMASSGQWTPAQAQQLVMQAAHASTIGGYDLTPLKQATQDPQSFSAYLGALAAGANTPKEAADIAKTKAETGAIPATTAATTAQAAAATSQAAT